MGWVWEPSTGLLCASPGVRAGAGSSARATHGHFWALFVLLEALLNLITDATCVQPPITLLSVST